MIDWSKFRCWLTANTNTTEEYVRSFEKDCGKDAARRVMLEVWYDYHPKLRPIAKAVHFGWLPMDPRFEEMGLAAKGKFYGWFQRFIGPRAEINPPEELRPPLKRPRGRKPRGGSRAKNL